MSMKTIWIVVVEWTTVLNTLSGWQFKASTDELTVILEEQHLTLTQVTCINEALDEMCGLEDGSGSKDKDADSDEDNSERDNSNVNELANGLL